MTIGSSDSLAVNSPLYGRERELRQIEKLLAQTRDESIPQAVRIVGRSGYGKTAVVDTVVGRADRAGWSIFRATCHPGQQHAALAALRRMVNVGLNHLEAERARYVSGLESELASPEAHVSRYQTAVIRMFEGLLLDRPVLIAIDDIQWLDAESASCFERLMSSAAASRLFVIFGDRRDQAAPTSELPIIDIALKPLDKEAALQIVRSEFPDGNSDVVAAIVERAQGVPFDLKTLASQAARDGAHSIDEVLKSVKTAIADQIQALSAPVRDFLQLCALIEEPIELRILHLLTRDERALLMLVDSVVPRYLVADGRELRFTHALVGEAVRSTIVLELPLQKRILKALLGASEPNLRSFDRVAHHAGECGDRSIEYDYTVRLAHEAFAIEAFDAAIAAFQRALGIQSPPSQTYVSFFSEYAMALRVTDRWGEARDVLEEALRQGMARKIEGLGPLAASLVWCISLEEDVHRAKLRYDELMSRMIGRDRLELLGVGAMLAMQLGEPAALAAIKQELGADQEAGSVGRFIIAEAGLAAYLGHFEEAKAHLQEARALDDPHTLHKFTTEVVGLWIDFFQRGCVVQEQLPRLLRHEQRELPRAVIHDVLDIGMHSDLARGRWEDAMAKVEAATPQAMRTGDSRLHALAVSAAIAAFTGRAPSYSDMIQADLSAAIRNGYRDRALELGYWWTAYKCRQDHTAAAALASKLRGWLNADTSFSTFFLPIAAFLYALRASDEALLADLASRTPRAERSPWHRAHELLAVGAAKHALHRNDGAANLVQAEEIFRTLCCDFYAAFTAEILSRPTDNDMRLLLALGVREDGTQKRISAFPGKTKGRSAVAAAAPSVREMQVAELVAEGYSNRKIAEELVLSERTVEAHIANIFSKLDISSRTQLTRWIIERREAIA